MGEEGRERDSDGRFVCQHDVPHPKWHCWVYYIQCEIINEESKCEIVLMILGL